jgi:hypothetical protein
VGKLRQGLARLIDSYAEGLIEKQEFEPRVTRLRQRITHVKAQCHQLAEAETLQRELRLIVGRVEDFAAQVQQNLDNLEWQRKREILRALVRRVEIGLDQVQVVFRVDAFAGEADPEKKSLQLCKRSKHRPLWHPSNRGPLLHPFQDILVEEPLEQIEQGPITDLLCDTRQQWGFRERVKIAFDVGIHDPRVALFQPPLDLPEGIFTPSPRSKTIIAREKLPLKDGLHDHGDRRLHNAIFDRCNPQGPGFPRAFRDMHTSGRQGLIAPCPQFSFYLGQVV